MPVCSPQELKLTILAVCGENRLWWCSGCVEVDGLGARFVDAGGLKESRGGDVGWKLGSRSGRASPNELLAPSANSTHRSLTITT